MATKARVHNGEIVFSSPLAKYRFLQAAEGKEIKLDLNERPTPEMRKYFEGCLVPAFFYFHPHAGWETFADAREVLKLEFAPGTRQVEDLDGNWVRVAPSTTDMSKTRFEAFLDAITSWMVENGMPIEVLDHEAYKVWRDTNYTDLIYPPLARLKELYEKQKPAT